MTKKRKRPPAAAPSSPPEPGASGSGLSRVTWLHAGGGSGPGGLVAGPGEAESGRGASLQLDGRACPERCSCCRRHLCHRCHRTVSRWTLRPASGVGWTVLIPKPAAARPESRIGTCLLLTLPYCCRPTLCPSSLSAAPLLSFHQILSGSLS